MQISYENGIPSNYSILMQHYLQDAMPENYNGILKTTIAVQLLYLAINYDNGRGLF